MAYIKMKDLDGKTFTVQKYLGRKYKRWNEAAKKMEVSETPAQGFSARFAFETEKGELEMSGANVGDMCKEILNKDGVANLIGKTYSVKTNGKQGLEVRYWINLVRQTETQRIIKEHEDSAIIF